ncbi:hypothetical protein C4G84_RS13495 [Vibrio parahaemolyticus O5:K30]|nr:hypothetical protein [Vibrio parahaemolyticus O5:K30]
MITNKKLLAELTSIKELHPKTVTCVVTGGAYFNELPKIDLLNDYPKLISYMYKEGDGRWAIAVEAQWGYFGRYPIAYIRTIYDYDNTYEFGEEFKEVQSVIEQYDFPEVRSVLASYMEQS